MGGWSGVVGSHDSGGLKACLEVTLPNGPIHALDTTKAKSMDKITSQSCSDLQLLLTASRAN